MSDASTSHGSEPNEPARREPLFPSEGEFSAVVPLSEVGRAPVSAERTPDDARPAEAGWAREAHRGTALTKRGAKAFEEEETLVPSRSKRERRVGDDTRPGARRRAWPVTTAAVVLSVLAGVAAGSYLVWSKRPAVVNRPETREVANDINAHATAAAPPAEVAAPPAPDLNARVADAKTEGPPEPSARPAKSTPTTVEPPAREAALTREAAPTRPRAERAAAVVAPAPKPSRADAPARSDATDAERRQARRAVSRRDLPVSAPPPSARSKTVIQWP